MNEQAKELIQKLENFSGGLNLRDQFPATNEFKALKNWENHGKFLTAMIGSTNRHETDQEDWYSFGKYKASAGDEYVLFFNGSTLSAVKVLGSSASTATTYVDEEVLDLSDVAVAVSTGLISEQNDIFQIQDRMFAFAGTGWNSYNIVSEYSTATTSDFVGRQMGIVAPTVRPTMTHTGTGLTGTWRYKWKWIRKDGNGVVVSESGGNTAASGLYYGSDTAADDSIVVSMNDLTEDPQVGFARLFRTLDLTNANNSSSLYYRLADVAVTYDAPYYKPSTTYTDSMSDEELFQQSAADLLVDEFHAPFPACKHGAYAGKRIFCSDGSKIYYSSTDQRKLETYDIRGYSVLLDGTLDTKTSSGFIEAKAGDGLDVTGLFEVNGNLVVMKEDKTGVMFNADPMNGIRWTDPTIGSINKASMAKTPYGLMGFTNKGVRTHDGTKWSNRNISDLVIKHNNSDGTKRVCPQTGYAVGGSPKVIAFYYDNKYWMYIYGQDGDGPAAIGLVWDAKMGWAEHSLAFDGAAVYDEGHKVVGLRANDWLRTFFDSDSAFTGVIQHGYGRGDHALEFVDAVVDSKLSSAASFMVKTALGVSALATDIKPSAAESETPTRFIVIPGRINGTMLATKLKGSIKRGDTYLGQKVKYRTFGDYSYDNLANNGMIARYNCDSITGTTELSDYSGNGADLTLTWSGTAPTIATQADTVARVNGVAIANTLGDEMSLRNATGLKLSAFGEWTIALKVFLPTGIAETFYLIDNTANGHVISVRWNETLSKLMVSSGLSAHAFTSDMAKNSNMTAILTYRYKAGDYSDVAESLSFNSKLYVNGAAGVAGVAISSDLPTSDGLRIFHATTTDTDGVKADEIRVYNRAITDEEAAGIYSEFYNCTETDSQYF